MASLRLDDERCRAHERHGGKAAVMKPQGGDVISS
jgi:hypothetical protein